MCLDRRKSSIIKRYELGFRLTIDWCVRVTIFAVMLLIYFSSANPVAYHNATGSENLIAGGSGKYNAFSNDLLKGKLNLKSKKYSYSDTQKLSSDTESINKFDRQKLHVTTEGPTDETTVTNLNEHNSTDISEGIELTTTEINAIITTEGLEFTTENPNDETTVSNLNEQHSTTISEGLEPTTDINENVLTLKNIDELLETTTENSRYETTATNQDELLSTDISEGLEHTTTVVNENVSTLKSIVDNFNESSDIVEGMKLNYETTTEVSDETTTVFFTTEVNSITTDQSFTTITNIDVDSNKTKNVNSTLKDNITNITETVRKCRDCDNKYNNKHTTKKHETEVTTQSDYNLSYEDYEEEIVKAFSLSTTSTTTERSNPFNSLRNLASSFIETLYETYVPKTFKDVFTRMQKQNDRLEMVRLRSREENGGLGQFGRSIIKGLSEPLNQLMQGVRDYGSLDSDKNFFAGVASDIVSLADSVSDSFKDRVRAIYPGTLWCGDGDMARSAEVGLFFMTDNCCKRHDACKYYIPAGATKYGLMNTGIFTRSHCECDRAFYKCLKRTNSFISMQIGLTYFSILGPQCFKHEHPIVKCNKKASGMTGSKCEEYQLDYKQPKMWQWFDSETF